MITNDNDDSSDGNDHSDNDGTDTTDNSDFTDCFYSKIKSIHPLKMTAAYTFEMWGLYRWNL